MFKAFCYCCKKHVTVNEQEDFAKSGHVNTKADARGKYQLATNKLKRNIGRTQ